MKGRPFRKAWELAVGFGILCLFLAAGAYVKSLLHLTLPGNVLGLFLLLGAVALDIVKVQWFELASKWLLYLMPLLFVPIYVGAGAYKDVWARWGWLIVSSMVLAVLAMWVFVGHFAQRIFSAPAKISEDRP
jgi:holin-like protein